MRPSVTIAVALFVVLAPVLNSTARAPVSRTWSSSKAATTSPAALHSNRSRLG
jgi:hypothetical protein